MKKVNQIVFCRKDFSFREKWEELIKAMIMCLLDAGQIMTVRYDEPGLGIVVIEFEPDDQSLGGYYPYWLCPEEIESVVYNDEDE